jgi:hypothetical protein
VVAFPVDVSFVVSHGTFDLFDDIHATSFRSGAEPVSASLSIVCLESSPAKDPVHSPVRIPGPDPAQWLP